MFYAIYKKEYLLVVLRYLLHDNLSTKKFYLVKTQYTCILILYFVGKIAILFSSYIFSLLIEFLQSLQIIRKLLLIIYKSELLKILIHLAHIYSTVFNSLNLICFAR